MDTTIKQTVITNNVPRLLLYGYELSDKEREEFDYISDEDMLGRGFVRYKGELYDLGDMMRVPPGSDLECQGWQAYDAESAFSATVLKYCDDDSDRVICGRAFW